MLVYWVTKHHERIPLTRMETRHIMNTQRMIAQGRMTRPGCSGFTNAQWLQIFKTELTRRSRLGAL